MEPGSEKDGMFTCSTTFGDVLIIGEQLRVRMHTDRSNLIRDQRYLFRSYPTCFCGQEVVSWLVKTQRAPERFIAVALMNILLDHNIIHQVAGSSAFKDDSSLYRFRKDDGTHDFMEDTALFLRAHNLCKRLSEDGQGHKLVRSRVQDQQLYSHCFLGCEMINWMVQRQEAPSREDAVKELRTMLENGIMRHVTDQHHFRDDQSLYQFRTDFARERILLDLVLPPPEPEFGGPLLEVSGLSKSSSGHSLDNNNSCLTVKDDATKDACDKEPEKLSEHLSEGLRAIAQRTESGYHSDHMDTPPSSLSESPMFDLEDRPKDSNEDRPGPFSGGVLIRRATIEELENPDSPYVKKFIRIVSDPVGYGFVIRGEGPVFIKAVDPMGPAAAAGLKVGHYIYSVNDQKVLSMHHKDLAHVILDSNGYVTLVILEHVRDTR